MIVTKRLGICMDHSNAHLIEFSSDVDRNEKKVIVSKFSHEANDENGDKSEMMMHKKEQHQTAEYYKELGLVIRNYESVILFGPTTAKVELLNILKSDNHFAKIKIEVHNTDKMTDNQQQAFVREYFSKQA